jgi:transcriptional regulator with XRE-family HTH domain
MTNKEKFLKLVSESDESTLEQVRYRIKNRAMLRESQKIALKVLIKLDKLHWSQRDLAKKMDVSPQQINKIVSGKENLSIETQIKLQTILDIPVLASYYEDKIKENKSDFSFTKTSVYNNDLKMIIAGFYDKQEKNSISIKMLYDKNAEKYSYQKEAV